MLVAIKLLLAIAVLCYGVSLVLADQAGDFVCSAFQAPLTHLLGHTSGGATSAKPTSSDQTSTQTTTKAKAQRLDSPLYSKRQAIQTIQHRSTGYESPFDSKVITTVDGLRTKHGEGTFWGDLNHVETRFVYHKLLPRQLLKDVNVHKNLAVEDLARLASMARHAARLYARERSSLPLRLMAGLYDGIRHYKTFGRWSWTGMTYEEVWAKYERQILAEMAEEGTPIVRSEVNRLVALRILQKSCQTNPAFDRLASVERAERILARAARRHIERENLRLEARRAGREVSAYPETAEEEKVQEERGNHCCPESKPKMKRKILRRLSLARYVERVVAETSFR